MISIDFQKTLTSAFNYPTKVDSENCMILVDFKINGHQDL